MADRLEFTAKLAGILKKAQNQENRMTLHEVEVYFEEDALSEEQLGLVCEYLMSQKVIVSGFQPKARKIIEATADGESNSRIPAEEGMDQKQNLSESNVLSDSEKSFAESYLREIAEMRPRSKEERLLKKYLPKVVEIAMDLKCSEVLLGDLIQEGSMLLMLELQKLREPAEIVWEDEEETQEANEIQDSGDDKTVLSSSDLDVQDPMSEEVILDEEKEREIMEEVRAGILTMIEEQTETKARDKKMVNKVSDLDEVIQKMKDDYGRKVAVDEVAEHLGVSAEEIADILKLAGEEAPTEEEVTDLLHVVDEDK